MTIHVSLPKELENMVHAEVKSGMHNSASEVVRAALRKFFSGNDTLSAEEISWIRANVESRLQAVKAGTVDLLDGETVFDELDEMGTGSV